MDPIPLGPFQLLAPLAKGGMGEVWRGIHVEQQVPVAVKVLSVDGAEDPDFHHALREEVRAVAGLQHPHVVWVYDHGDIGADTTARSDGRLPAGSPYLVLEYSARGTLKSVLRTLDFEGLRGVLTALLDALAHAHARGVIHRDIKPANILLDGARPGLKLTDFGIAYALDRRTSETVASAGTPVYMAPEQFFDDAADIGPWTDLYAVGALTWSIATGRFLYKANRWEALARLHANAPIPKFSPRMAVPDGFEGWLRRCVAKRPEERFRWAADALYALQSLKSVSRGPAVHRPAMFDPNAVTRLLPEARIPVGRKATRAAIQDGFPPMSGEWRAADPHPPTGKLHGAGLRLFGLRPIHLAGRTPERDLLWSCLTEVANTGQARAVSIRGPSGVGKSRLAQWLGHRAHEVGAHVLRATHDPLGGAADGIAGMLGREIRALGADADRVRARARDTLARLGVDAPDEVEALAQLVQPHEVQSTTHIRFRSAQERHAVVRRFVQRLARIERRPIVLLLDDVSLGLDAIVFAIDLLTNAELDPVGVLVVTTAADESLATHGPAAEALGRLEAMQSAVPVRLGPLEPAEQIALIADLLHLEPDLAVQVADRTSGNPMFAVQLVGDWIQRGLVTLGKRGFRVRPGATLTLPTDVEAVWRDHLARVLEGRSPSDRVALELAAVLGLRVEPDEWSAVCRLVDVRPPTELVDELVDARLAVRGSQGEGRWSFVHGMLRETLEAQARDAGRLEGHHWRCAEMLAARDGGPGDAPRLGRHWLRAGAPDRAHEALLQGAIHLATQAPWSAEPLLREHAQALEQAGIPTDDARWIPNWAWQSNVQRRLARFDEARENARRALAAAEARGDAEACGLPLRDLAEVDMMLGEFDSAEATWSRALAEGEAAGSDALIGPAARGLGVLCAFRGRLDEARELLDRALVATDKCGNTYCYADAALGLAYVAHLARDREAMARHLVTLKETSEWLGSRQGLALALNMEAEADRYDGRLEAAEAKYRESLRLMEAIGSSETQVARINLGMVLLDRDDPEQAAAELQKCLSRVKDRPTWVVHVHTALMACAAHTGDRMDFRKHRLQASELLAETQHVDADVARLTLRSGQLALEHGWRREARRAYEMALSQAEALGRDDDARSAREALAAL